MITHYASLIGPLFGIYYPLPVFENLSGAELEHAQRLALNTSRISKLWCSIYTKEETGKHCEDYGGIMLSRDFAQRLDYNFDEVDTYIRGLKK